MDSGGLSAVAIGVGGAVGTIGLGAAGGAVVVVCGVAYTGKLIGDLIVAMSHLDKVKAIGKELDRIEKWIRDQLIRLRNEKNPEVRRRINESIKEARDYTRVLRRRQRDIASGGSSGASG
jgi:hypothetical protein